MTEEGIEEDETIAVGTTIKEEVDSGALIEEEETITITEIMIAGIIIVEALVDQEITAILSIQ